MRQKTREKLVLVTGGANGIGRGIVEEYQHAGDRVLFTDVDAAGGRALEQKHEKVYFEALDSGDLTAVEGFLEQVVHRYGLPDILIHNVGISKFKPLLELTTEEFLEIQRVNYISGYVLAREWIRLREQLGKQKEYGRMVWISSTRCLQSEPDSEAYAASKGAVASLTHALAASTAGHAVTVNCISPGWIENGDYGALTPADHAQHFSGRVGLASDIARTCKFLTVEENDFINGQNLFVDGGMTKKMSYV